MTDEENNNQENNELDPALLKIANNANRSEKTSWNRKMNNMVSLMSKLRPIEQQIIDLQAQKIPIMDDIMELRNTMVKECIHPYEYLVRHQGYAKCKFCDKKMSLPNTDEEN